MGAKRAGRTISHILVWDTSYSIDGICANFLPAGVSKLSVLSILKKVVETAEQIYHGLQAGLQKIQICAQIWLTEMCFGSESTSGREVHLPQALFSFLLFLAFCFSFSGLTFLFHIRCCLEHLILCQSFTSDIFWFSLEHLTHKGVVTRAQPSVFCKQCTAWSAQSRVAASAKAAGKCF